MQLDLKNVRVTYTLREVVLALGTVLGLCTHVVRTEIQHHSDEAQIVQNRADIEACKRDLAASKLRASR